MDPKGSVTADTPLEAPVRTDHPAFGDPSQFRAPTVATLWSPPMVDAETSWSRAQVTSAGLAGAISSGSRSRNDFCAASEPVPCVGQPTSVKAVRSGDFRWAAAAE